MPADGHTLVDQTSRAESPTQVYAAKINTTALERPRQLGDLNPSFDGKQTPRAGPRYRKHSYQDNIRSMKLTEISCTGYKVFRDNLNLEIRPLTVLVGKNNVGKSALARLPILLMHALSTRSDGPLDLRVGPLEFGNSFLDLLHRRRQHGMTRFCGRR